MVLDIVCYLHTVAQLAKQLVADRSLPGRSNKKLRLFAADLQAFQWRDANSFKLPAERPCQFANSVLSVTGCCYFLIVAPGFLSVWIILALLPKMWQLCCIGENKNQQWTKQPGITLTWSGWHHSDFATAAACPHRSAGPQPGRRRPPRASPSWTADWGQKHTRISPWCSILYCLRHLYIKVNLF